MTGYSVIAIARKEFFDQLISRKFLLILGILLIVSIIGILNGVSNYNASVTSYNNLENARIIVNQKDKMLILDRKKLIEK